jgi:hypothetical protein
MDKAARIREAERRFRELESERNRYDILVGQLERGGPLRSRATA